MTENKFRWLTTKTFAHRCGEEKIVSYHEMIHEQVWTAFPDAGRSMSTSTRYILANGPTPPLKYVVPHPFGYYACFDTRDAMSREESIEICGPEQGEAYDEGVRLWADGVAPRFNTLNEALNWLVTPRVDA